MDWYDLKELPILIAGAIFIMILFFLMLAYYSTLKLIRIFNL
jgi:hypothetical protein